MAELKTKVTEVSPVAFVEKVENEQKRTDSRELIKLMKDVTGKPAKMWGPSIIGFGKYHYKYESGREGDLCMTGFSPRKDSLVLYLGSVLEEKALMSKLGKHKTGKGCLYIKKLDDVDRSVLKQLVGKAVAKMRETHECE